MKNREKFFKGKTLAILTGGGDTPALNASIEAIKSRAAVLGFKVFGVLQGWKGLLGEGDIVNLTGQPYDGWYGGTALFSSRTNPFPSKKNPIDRTEQVLTNLKRYKIDVLVSIGGDDTNGAAKKMYENFGIPVIGFPKTIDNDLRTQTFHRYNDEIFETVLCPGFPTAAQTVADLTSRLRTTAESHKRIIVIEVMGRDAGWLTGSAKLGGAQICLIPEYEMTQERKLYFYEKVKEKFTENKKQFLIIAVAEGVRWFNETSGKTEVVCASAETDEFGHQNLGGVSGLIASEIKFNTGIDARAQNLGYLARSGTCSLYDKRFVNILADSVVDLLLREDYGKMPVLKRLTRYEKIEEYNTAFIDMGQIENMSLNMNYYNSIDLNFNKTYYDFLKKIAERPCERFLKNDFPKVDFNLL